MHNRLVADYFAESPRWDDENFERRFRMSRPLFLRIVEDLERSMPFFRLSWDARGRRGYTGLHKATAAIRQLAYGGAADAVDEYLKMSERTARESLYKFCRGIIKLYSKKYLRRPNWNDVGQIYELHEERHNLPGMLGSLDVMHWEWENCPNAWRGQYMRGDHSHPTIMLEAVASHDQWIWHAFFGVAGSNNDINVLNQSPIFDDIIRGVAPDTGFTVCGVEYKHGYYLADGIYPEYACIVKTFREPDTDAKEHFKKRQEAARKGIERTFGTLKQRWHILKRPARAWTPKRMRQLMYACVILHNMILEDKGLAYCEYVEDEDDNQQLEWVDEEAQWANRNELRDSRTHHALRTHLVKHLWEKEKESIEEAEEDAVQESDEDGVEESDEDVADESESDY